jgi:hypothetical protein
VEKVETMTIQQNWSLKQRDLHRQAYKRGGFQQGQEPVFINGQRTCQPRIQRGQVRRAKEKFDGPGTEMLVHFIRILHIESSDAIRDAMHDVRPKRGSSLNKLRRQPGGFRGTQNFPHDITENGCVRIPEEVA